MTDEAPVPYGAGANNFFCHGVAVVVSREDEASILGFLFNQEAVKTATVFAEVQSWPENHCKMAVGH